MGSNGCAHSSDPVPCAQCADAVHDAQHPERVDGCFACKMRTIQFGAAVAPKHAHRPVPPRKAADPAWERGVAGEHRPDGSFMPLIDGSLRKIHVKEAGERRSEFATARRRLDTPAVSA